MLVESPEPVVGGARKGPTRADPNIVERLAADLQLACAVEQRLVELYRKWSGVADPDLKPRLEQFGHQARRHVELIQQLIDHVSRRSVAPDIVAGSVRVAAVEDDESLLHAVLHEERSRQGFWVAIRNTGSTQADAIMFAIGKEIAEDKAEHVGFLSALLARRRLEAKGEAAAPAARPVLTSTMEVYTRDGRRVGRIESLLTYLSGRLVPTASGVGPGFLQVRRSPLGLLARDLFIPMEAVMSVHRGRVILTVEQAELSRQKWTNRPPTTEPATP